MKNSLTLFFAVAAMAAEVSLAGSELSVRRVLKPARHTRGDTNVRPQQPIDSAGWLWHPEQDWGDTPFVGEPKSYRFRRRFTSDGSVLKMDVSADNRFTLFVDGERIGRGPDRGSVENWTYHSYEVTLPAGEHVMEAVCWTHWGQGPSAQITYRGGFVLKAEGSYDRQLTTGGKAQWEVGRLVGTKLVYAGIGGGCGLNVDSTGCGILYEQPSVWTNAVVVRGPAGDPSPHVFGGRTSGWMLFPTQLKPQLERRIAPGAFVCAMDKVSTEADLYDAAGEGHPQVVKFNALLRNGAKSVVPANTRVSLVWDLGDYYAAYPHLRVSGGRGATVVWGWAESLYTPKGQKGDRAAYLGKRFVGAKDTFRADGRADAVFSTQWWRCGRWCELKVETKDEPLVFEELALDETRYDLEPEGAFACDDASLGPIQKICTRVMQMCAHETLFDGPFYEQLMYPGDTRIQLLTLSALARDDRMIRRAIEFYSLAQRDDGMIPMSWPSQYAQESATYTQCWLLMLGDYALYHDDTAWLRAQLPAMRKAMTAFSNMTGADGLVANLPGWNFMDWVARWPKGTCPSALPGDEPAALANLFWALCLESAAATERALGDEAMARYWEAKLPPLRAAIRAKFWDAGRGLLADTAKHDEFSEHAQCLGILSGVLTGGEAKRAFEAMVAETDPKFARCTVYFSHYLFAAYFRMGRGDLFLKRLDLWREYVKMGLSTTLECPESDAVVSRSDCHAWGSHPLYWMQAGLAGVKPAAPAFARVAVEPNPGALAFVKAKVPHPQGFVEVDLAFKGGHATGSVDTPVSGAFAFGGVKVELKPGHNEIR